MARKPAQLNYRLIPLVRVKVITTKATASLEQVPASSLSLFATVSCWAPKVFQNLEVQNSQLFSQRLIIENGVAEVGQHRPPSHRESLSHQTEVSATLAAHTQHQTSKVTMEARVVLMRLPG